jgi:hypothetical protein
MDVLAHALWAAVGVAAAAHPTRPSVDARQWLAMGTRSDSQHTGQTAQARPRARRSTQ